MIRADDSAREADPLETIVVTATRRPTSADSMAVAISVVSGEEALHRGIDVLPEALRGTPGAFFQQTTPGQGTPIIRGLRGSQVMHLVDGMRINNAFFRDAPNQYVALVDPFLIERAELLRGAAGSLYGADAMGGVLALKTRTPRFERDDTERRYRLYAGYDSVDRGWQTRAEGAAGNRRGSLAGGVTWQNRNHRRTGDGVTVRPTAYESYAGDFRWHLAPDPDREWLFQVQTLEQPDTPRVDELTPGFGQADPASSEYRFSPNRRTFLHGRYRASLPHRWASELRLDLARQVIVDDRQTRDFESPLRLTEQNESTLDGFTIQGRSRPWRAADLVWGLELYRDDVRSARQVEHLPTGDRRDTRPRFPDGAELDSEALYAQVNWSHGRWHAETGLRYSRFDIRLPAGGEAPATMLKPDDLTGDLRLRYDTGRSIQLVTNLGRGFRPPNVFDLGALGPRPGNRFNVPNPDLRPETVWSLDVGIKAGADRWRAELFAFVLDYQDKITSVPTGGVTEEGRVVVRSENRAEARIRGIEAALDWQWTTDLVLAMRLNATRGEERTADGITVPGDRIPPLNGRLSLTWRPMAAWRLEPFIDFAGRQDRLSPRDVTDPRIDPNGTAGWATLNVHAQWRAWPGLVLGLRLDNLLDEAYREHGSGIDGPGRNVGVWADAQF